MDYFDEIITFVLKSEGGYVNDPKDPGGETKYGISKRAYPMEDIKNLTLDKAKAIYRRDYYDKAVDSKMTFGQAAFMFDTAVNMGVGTARRFWGDSDGGDLQKLFALRKTRYDEIIKARPTSEKYRKGWMNRLTLLQQFINKAP